MAGILNWRFNVRKTKNCDFAFDNVLTESIFVKTLSTSRFSLEPLFKSKMST